MASILIPVSQCTELTISFDQLEYTVSESNETVSAIVSITSPGGWAIPLEFLAVSQDYTAISGQNLYIQTILFSPWLLEGIT